MRKILFLISMIGLVYAMENYKTGTNIFSFNKICIDNVVYIKRGKMLSPYIDSKSLKFIRCNESK